MSTFDERTQLSVPHFRCSIHSASSSHLPSNCPQGSASEQHKSKLYGFKPLHPGPGPIINICCMQTIITDSLLKIAMETNFTGTLLSRQFLIGQISN